MVTMRSLRLVKERSVVVAAVVAFWLRDFLCLYMCVIELLYVCQAVDCTQKGEGSQSLKSCLFFCFFIASLKQLLENYVVCLFYCRPL